MSLPAELQLSHSAYQSKLSNPTWKGCYQGQYVAFIADKFVGANSSREVLLKQIRKEFANQRVNIFIKQVPPDASSITPHIFLGWDTTEGDF